MPYITPWQRQNRIQDCFKYSIKLRLFSAAVVVGLPKSLRDPMAHRASIILSWPLPFAAFSSRAKCP